MPNGLVLPKLPWLKPTPNKPIMHAHFLYPCLASLLVLTCTHCGNDQSATGSTDSSQESTSASNRPSMLSYQESVNAVMDPMTLNMSYDEGGERKELKGQVTMLKQRFATVKHPSSQMKSIHLRQWAKVHQAAIIGQDMPRGNETNDSPITDGRLEAHRTNEGWQLQIPGVQETPEIALAMKEMETIENAAYQFYQGQTVREGESWQVPAPAVARWFGADVSDMTGAINLNVGAQEAIEDTPCSKIAITIKTTGKMTDEDGKISDMAIEANGSIWRAVDLGEDLKVDIKGTVTLTATMPEQNAKVVIDGPLEITETRKLRK